MRKIQNIFRMKKGKIRNQRGVALIFPDFRIGCCGIRVYCTSRMGSVSIRASRQVTPSASTVRNRCSSPRSAR